VLHGTSLSTNAQRFLSILSVLSVPVTVLAIATIAARLAVALRQSLGVAAPTVAAVAFLVLARVALSSRHGERTRFRDVARDLAIGVVVALVLMDKDVVQDTNGALKDAVWFFVPAAVEEMVFRQQIQQRFGDTLRSFLLDEHTRYASAAVLAGLTFAASHYVLLRSPLSPGAMANLARLFALALVMTLVVRFAGVGVAIGAHAAFNGNALLRVPWSTVQPSGMTVAIAMVGALVCLRYVGPLQRECDAAELAHP
jgi:membrane protease YdiL (CAAX protease family)